MENVEIRNVKKLKDGGIKCDVALTSREFGVIVIKGFRVTDSHNYGEIWVQEPSYQVYGHYLRCFYLENRETWDSLKGTLIDTYSSYRRRGDLCDKRSAGDSYFADQKATNFAQSAKSDYSDQENINPDEIPI